MAGRKGKGGGREGGGSAAPRGCIQTRPRAAPGGEVRGPGHGPGAGPPRRCGKYWLNYESRCHSLSFSAQPKTAVSKTTITHSGARPALLWAHLASAQCERGSERGVAAGELNRAGPGPSSVVFFPSPFPTTPSPFFVTLGVAYVRVSGE